MLSKKITDCFKGDELASEVFLNKYSLNKEETPDDMHKRMAKEFARIIFNYRDKITEDKIRNLSPYGQGFFRLLKIQTKEDLQDMIHHYFKNFESIIPQGSVMSGLSSEKPVSLSNCFVLPSPEDTIESIVNTGRNAAQIYKRRGGVGFDISNLRPKGASVNNASSLSTGAVSFMPLYSMITEIIGQDGRRGALMLSIDINHPDVMDFATIKRDLTKVTGANISIKLNQKFINAVKNNEDYILRWPLETNISNLPINDIVYNELKFFYTKEGSPYYIKKVKAKELWDIIVESNWLSAEPGIFNWDLLINYDPTGVYNELRPISTNPCQPKWAPLLSKKGIISFEDAEVGDLIWSEEGWTTIIKKESSGIKPIYEYKTTAGSFIGTDTHRVISKGNKIEVKDSSSIDLLQGYYDEKSIIEEESVMAGLLIGDGMVHKANNDLILLCIGSKDQDYFDSEISSFIGKHRPEIKDYAYEVNTSLRAKDLDRVWNRIIPEQYLYGSSSKVRGFLRGLYSANGSVVDKRITLKTTSPMLRDQVQVLLSSVGIRSYFTTNKVTNTIHHNGIYESKESYDINISTDRELFYNSIGFIQKYKMLKLESTLGTTKEGLKTHDIIEIIPLGEEEVFNITVNNSTHTYWTGGMNVSNCGELGLSGLDSCRLILSNLYSLIKNPFEKESKFDEVLGYSVFYFTQILADALVDLEIEAIDRVLNKIQPDYEKFIRGYNTVSDFLSEQSEEFKLWWKIREIGEKGRRTGTGITAYGDMCAALGLKYGDKELTESVFKTKLRAELDSTTDLAIILEPFPLWDKTKEFEFYGENEIKGRNEWYQFIIDELPIQAKRMAYWGRRNSGISTVAPAGSVSILTQTTSGIEPLFSPYYTRRKKCNRNEKPDFVDQNGVGFKNFLVVHPKLKEYAEIKKEFFTKSFHQFPENIEEYNAENWDVVYNYSPYAHNTSDTIPLDVRIDTQALIQKYITSSISSTCNVPKEFTREQMSEGYLRAFEKGCKGLTYYRDGSRSGILFTGKDNDKEEFPQYDATKRKKTLDAELHMSKSKGRHFAFIVGLLEGKPYEIFGYDTLGEKLKECKGTITRVKKGHYRFESDDLIIDNISDESNSELEKACTIYTSMLLRTGAKIEYVISVSKNKINNNISSFVSSMCRVLNKYNKTIDYLVCDSCGGEVRLENGCQTCMDCGDSKCN